MAGLLKITLIRSMIGRPDKHCKVLKGMGLTKTGKTVMLQNTPSVRGMINKVSHLLNVVEEMTDES